ncbi:MAG: glycoside hydrolase family 16 protein [Candidatus Cloacimonadales bacterium]
MKATGWMIFFIMTLLLSLFIAGCDNITDPESVIDPTVIEEYVLVWSDEFEAENLDMSNWNYEQGYGQDGWGNDEWQEYTNQPENVRLEDGNLVISAIWDSLNYSEPGKRDGSITSARINSKDKFSFKYGKIKARIKVPGSNGMWPAFWMLGSNFDTSGWPYCGEIDIMEISPLYHGDNTTICTIHWWDDENENHIYEGSTKSFSSPLTEDYHIYEVEWDEQRIIGKIDGIIYFTKVIDVNTMSEFLRDFFLIFNVAVGGNLGGEPNENTDWQEQMLVDWVRVYQAETNEEEINTFGIFTDETEVDAGITVGADAEIYVWENTLTSVFTAPYEGENVISFQTAGLGWFGAGIQSNLPIDLQNFANGWLKFMIKIPANVSFKIGIIDLLGNENYLDFPANQTAFGLARNGEWGQAIVPVQDLIGNVDISMLSYEFVILEENGIQCQFAIDDIYYDKTGVVESSLSFSQSSYSSAATEADIFIQDEARPDSTVTIEVANEADSITLTVALGASGAGQTTVYFGETNEATSTISISEDETIVVSYENAAGELLTDSAVIEAVADQNYIGIYSESHTENSLAYSTIINSADWSGNSAVPDEESTAVTAFDGSYVLSVAYESGSAGWGGIAFDFGSADISDYTTLKFSIDTSNMPALAYFGIKLEDNSTGSTEVDLFSYTPVVSGNWATYEIPLNDFPGANLADLKYLGLWNPQDAGNTLLFDTLYFDDIHLTNDRGMER